MTDAMPDTPGHTACRVDAIRRDLDNLLRFAERIEQNLRSEAGEAGAAPGAAGTEGVWSLQENLPWLYRGSALLTLLGFFEHNLNALCDSLRRECGVADRVTDLPGKGLRRARRYITRHAGLPFPAGTGSWRSLLKYSDIRNLVAHRDSLVKDDDPELLRFIDADPCLSLDASGRVRLHEGALAEVIDHQRRFFEALSECLAAGHKSGIG